MAMDKSGEVVGAEFIPELEVGVDVFVCKAVKIESLDIIPDSAYLEEAAAIASRESEDGTEDGAENGAEEIEPKVVGEEVEAPKPTAQPKKSKKPAKDHEIRHRETLDSFWEVPDSIRGTLLGKLAGSVSEAYEFPEFSTFMTFLGAASCAVMCAYSTSYGDGDRVNPGLYVVVEQPPATGKSRILGVLISEYSKCITAHNRKVGAKNREIAERGIEIPCMPASFGYTTEPTAAAMDGAMAKLIDGRFVVASSEQSAFKMLFPQGKAFASTNELLLKGWPGEEVITIRGSRQAFGGKASGAVVLIAQDGSARTILGESEGTGLAERFFFVCEPSLLGSRLHLGNSPDHTLTLQVKNAIKRCVRMHSDLAFERWNSGVYEQMTLDDLPTIQPTKEGYEFLINIRRKNEPIIAALNESGDKVAAGWLGKAETQVLKVATILHVIDCLGAGCTVPQRIPMNLLHAAFDLTEVMRSHFLEMLSDNGDSGVSAEEDAIVDVLTLKPMVRRQLMLKLKNRAPFRSRGKAAYAAAGARIDAMLEQGSLVVTTSGKLEVV